MNDSTALLLSAHGVTKRYAVTVLRDANFDVRQGEVHALLGANGAGKSTLCRIIAGLIPATSGSMALEGRNYLPAGKAEAETRGVQIVQQELNLIPALSVAENLFLNRLPRSCGFVRYGQLREKALTVLRRMGLDDVSPDQSARTLGVGQQQMVEIAAALARECRLLILDEPTAALTARETEHLFERLRSLRATGVGIIYVTHRLDEVRQLADRATVLRDGQPVVSGAMASLSTEELVQAMTGKQPQAEHRHETHVTGKVALAVRGLSRGKQVRDVSFHVHKGERLGIAGLVGSGRTELLRTIFGADRADSGTLVLGGDDTPRPFRHPRQAVRAGLGLVTEDRKQDGLLLSQSIRVNTTLASLERFRRPLGRLDLPREWIETARVVEHLNTRCRSLDQCAGELSGGNQQKVVVSRWLLRDPKVLLLDEPTRGIDIGARALLYGLFDEMTARGMALVIVSSDVEELMLTCDRIAVVSAGRLVETFKRNNWSYQRIMSAAFREYLGGAATSDEGGSHVCN